MFEILNEDKLILNGRCDDDDVVVRRLVLVNSFSDFFDLKDLKTLRMFYWYLNC